MTKVTKMRKKQLAILADKPETVTLEQAVELVRKCAQSKFDETIDLDIKLGIDPRHSDQLVSGTTSLPHGTGKQVRAVVFAQDSRREEAQKAGADQFGSEDLIEEVLKTGKLNADVVIAEPAIMAKMAKIARILGPRGLMPNPKFGTVSKDIAKAVQSQKSGQIRFRNDKGANVHVSIGKASFTDRQLCENARFFINHLAKLRSDAVKGTFMLRTSLSSAMGPGVAFQYSDKKH